MILTRVLLCKTILKIFESDLLDYFLMTLLIPFTFLFDIALFPIEIIAIILYKKFEES